MGNGENRYWIEVTCPYKVTATEWVELLALVNLALQSYNSGQFANVSAHLEEIKD